MSVTDLDHTVHKSDYMAGTGRYTGA